MVCNELQVGASEVNDVVVKKSSLLDFLESVLVPTR